MPIVASRSAEIQRLLNDLGNPRRRDAAVLRLRSLGARVVPHALAELGRLDAEARRALVEVLADVATAEARSLRNRLGGAEAELSKPSISQDAEAMALEGFRRLPPPRRGESAAVSRNRGEAHLVLARLGSRLARKDLISGLATLEPNRARLYCEAAGLIGDAAFLEPLARTAQSVPEALSAIAAIVRREKITLRSRILRHLDESVRATIARAVSAD